MRRYLAILTALILVLSLITAVSATSATNVQSNAIVSSDGSCQVSLTVSLSLTTATDQMLYPLPAGARGVTVNGTAISTHKSGDVVYADISRLVRGLTGHYTLMFNYTLNNCVAFDQLGRTIVTVPLLSGFNYPVESMSFNITLPGEATNKPTFSSGYYESSIEEVLEFSVSGQTVSGYCTRSLKDLETLSMSIEMPTELFPQQRAEEFSVLFDDIAMYVCAGLALIYWLIFLRTLPPKRTDRFLPPEGLHAGELGSVLTGQGVDLTLLVLSWAQLGYVTVQVDNRGKVTLFKRMEMGNERSAFENKAFHSLFGKKDTVDATAYPFAYLHRKVAKFSTNSHGYFLPESGNPRIFRVLACGVGLFGGMSLGLAIGKGAFLVGFMVFLMVTLGTTASWLIQNAAYHLFLLDRKKVWTGLGCAAAWLLLGVLAKEFLVALLVVAVQLLAGIAAAYGGRRTDSGKQAMSEVLGLRRYLKKAPDGEFQRISRDSPDYFFTMAPFALALGVIEPFARQFGSMNLPACPYILRSNPGRSTAEDWAKSIVFIAGRMNEKQKRLAWERFLPPRI